MKMLCCFMLTLTLLASVCQAAPEAGRSYRLLILDSQFGNPYDEVRASLLSSLKAQGYHEGDNLAVTLHAAGNDIAAGVTLLRKEVTKGYDVIFVGGTVATIAAKQALYGSKQPVVFGSPTDPIGIGVIDGFDTPPKANFTGVCYPVPLKARLRFVRQLMPTARVFGLIYADMPQSHSYNRWLRQLIETDPQFTDIKVIFRPIPLVLGEDGDEAMATLAIPIIKELNSQVDAFLKPNDQLGTRRQFSEVVYKQASKPLIGIVKNDVMAKWGSTAVIYPSHESIGKQAAAMIGDLLEGKPIASIQPQWPRLYGYAVDLGKSRQFGIKVPVGILQLSGKNIVK